MAKMNGDNYRWFVQAISFWPDITLEEYNDASAYSDWIKKIMETIKLWGSDDACIIEELEININDPTYIIKYNGTHY